MGSRRVMQSLWRHKWLMSLGVLAGLALLMATLFAIEVERDGSDRITSTRVVPRRFAVYESRVNLLIDLPGFGIGRSDIGVALGIQLAPTYAYLVMSEPVRDRAEQAVGPIEDTVLVGAVDRSPVVRITVQGESAERTAEVADAMADAFIEYLVGYQEDSEIPMDKRVIVRKLGASTPPEEKQTRTTEIALIMLIAPIIVAGGLAVWLERPADAA